MSGISLTKREKQVMEIFWRSEQPLAASEVKNIDASLSINTIQAVIRKLLNRQLIHVASIGYSGKVLSRQYEASISEEEALKQMFSDETVKQMVSNYISDVKDGSVLDELSNLIDERKKNM